MQTTQLFKPKLLDLFCGAGGAATGYNRAGFEVVGVDIVPQPHYPFEFYQADALTFFDENWMKFDFFHASPPCQAFTSLRHIHKKEYPQLIQVVREAFKAKKKPWVIENVIGAPLINPVVLCGSYFGLKVYRHRLFEVNPWLLSPPHFPHRDSTPRSGHLGLSPKGFISVAGHFGNVQYAKKAMGIDWMNQSELAQAIPPAYTEWIGNQMMEVFFSRLNEPA